MSKRGILAGFESVERAIRTIDPSFDMARIRARRILCPSCTQTIIIFRDDESSLDGDDYDCVCGSWAIQYFNPQLPWIDRTGLWR